MGSPDQQKVMWFFFFTSTLYCQLHGSQKRINHSSYVFPQKNLWKILKREGKSRPDQRRVGRRKKLLTSAWEAPWTTHTISPEENISRFRVLFSFLFALKLLSKVSAGSSARLPHSCCTHACWEHTPNTSEPSKEIPTQHQNQQFCT